MRYNCQIQDFKTGCFIIIIVYLYYLYKMRTLQEGNVKLYLIRPPRAPWGPLDSGLNPESGSGSGRFYSPFF